MTWVAIDRYRVQGIINLLRQDAAEGQSIRGALADEICHCLDAAPAQSAEPVEVRERIARALHYPACWDVAAYPTLESAAWEAIACAKLGCSQCETNPTAVVLDDERASAQRIERTLTRFPSAKVQAFYDKLAHVHTRPEDGEVAKEYFALGFIAGERSITDAPVAQPVEQTAEPFECTHYDAFTEAHKQVAVEVNALRETLGMKAIAPPMEQTRALTDEQIREISLKYCAHEMPACTYNILRYECEEDFFNLVRDLTAARPASGETET
jgi:hypothetical protein